jgi:hypothetical protein
MAVPVSFPNRHLILLSNTMQTRLSECPFKIHNEAEQEI